MYEHKHRPLISKRAFLARMAGHVVVAAAVVAVSLGIGTLGYRVLADLSWVDSFLNASMILGGMGPVDRLASTPAKLFASFYALYAGFVLLISVSIILAPILHRLLHHFHLEAKGEDTDS
ncbi:MAG TPA: hypothetical protein VNZ22_04290 [Bacillota bacterium]|nr:hypothetical protein [Bacillota bacterium]